MARDSGKKGKGGKAKKAGNLPDFEPLRRLTKLVDGGVFFNADGSVVFHALHTRHLLFLLVPSALLPAAAMISWWILLGIPLCLAGFLRWLIKRKAADSLRLDFASGRIIRGEAVAPFALLTEESFRAVHGKHSSTLQCLLPRFEMNLPLEFYDLAPVRGAEDDGFGLSHAERAQTFLRLLWQCILQVRGDTEEDKAAGTGRAAARSRDASRSLTPDQLWMLQPGTMLAAAYGLHQEGLALRSSQGDSRAAVADILRDRWGISEPEEAVPAFGECVQGLRSLLAAVQPLALLPAKAQQGYLDYLEEAAEEISGEDRSRQEAGLPDELLPPPGPAFAKVLPLLHEEKGLPLLRDYAEALSDAHKNGVLASLLEAEARLCYQARVRRQISVLDVADIAGNAAGETALELLNTFVRRTGKDDASRCRNLMILQDLKKLRHGLGHNPRYTFLEAERLKALARPDQAILLGRNPYIAWDYARAALLRSMACTLGWERDMSGIWVDLRPLAQEIQTTFSDWTALFSFILAGQALDGDETLFGPPQDFSRVMRSRSVQNSLFKDSLPAWKLSLKAGRWK
ncbi:MAG: DUF1266 domain-containing protein [Desulfovibrio sp.]|jgi:hypothetical protein|nr:DUF1266 domain-containing protein [Desulfovibrio sp.]